MPEGSPLISLLDAGIVHPTLSHEALEAFLLEMSLPDRYSRHCTLSNNSPSILFLFDNISAISVPSLMRDPIPPHNFVHPHRLWLPFFFTCLLNGTLDHPRAAVVAATSAFPNARVLDIALGQAKHESYEPIDRRIAHSVDGAMVILAGDQLTAAEAMGLSAYYKETGLLKTVDRFDGISKTVGDEDYKFIDSNFFTAKTEDGSPERTAFTFRRRGRMKQKRVQDYIAEGGIVPKEDHSDFEATMQRLALGGGTARGFWKACTRMAYH